MKKNIVWISLGVAAAAGTAILLGGWLAGWKRKGWKRKGGELKNIPLWQELDRLLGLHRVNFNWLKGHDGHEYNERCDALAVAERDKYSRQ